MYRQRFLYSLYRHTHWVRCAKDLSLQFRFQKMESCFHQGVQTHRSYYGGLTLMIYVVKILREILRDCILIHHRIFLISTQEHHILMMAKLRLLKLIQSLR
uniref:POC1 centriolar protein B n=1 Tax=Oryctolagus cuniculus TaxID=9986 RepID=A0A5F9D5U8_RABIT